MSRRLDRAGQALVLSVWSFLMAGPRKTPDDEVSATPLLPGVGETGAVFEAPPVRDRWTIARERLAEHDRTGAGTMTVDEAMAELTALIEQRQASKT